MRDQFGREINYARISVTDRCNLRCRYCMPECGVPKMAHAEILSLEEILSVARVFTELGIKKIRLTGGEPLLRKNLPTLIRELKNLRGMEQVTLTTNGVLLKKFARELIAAGLDGVNLSLDTLDPKIFAELTRRDSFTQVLDGMRALLAEGLNFKINCVPLRGVNEAELIKMAALARSEPVSVRFIELMPIGCAWASDLRGVPTAEIFSTLEKVFGELIAVSKRSNLNGPAQYYQPRDFAGQIGFIDALEHKFCGGCNRIRLTADGFLKTCLSYDAGLDIKKLLRSGATDLAARIGEAIYRKPREHMFDALGKTFDKRLMNQVGG